MVRLPWKNRCEESILLIKKRLLVLELEFARCSMVPILQLQRLLHVTCGKDGDQEGIIKTPGEE